MLVVRPNGVVEAANLAARDAIPGLRIGAILPVEGESQPDGLLRYLRRCSTTGASVPGNLCFRRGEADYERHPCHGARVRLDGFDSGPIILLHLHAEELDRRFKILATKLHDARLVMKERRRRARQMQVFLDERELLLVRLEEDAAARRAAERERDEVLAQLYRAGQDERRRLARDLHDHAGQHLVALNFGLRRLAPHLTDAKAQAELERLLGQAQEVGQALRRVTLELRPAALDEFGFVTALRYLADEWTRATAIPTEFNVVGEERILSTELIITLYRMTQEALTNVAKHAHGATFVSVVVRFGCEHVTLAIDDNGSGFESVSSSTSSLVAQGKLGLMGMRERLALVGATLEIESSPGKGASVVARARSGTKGENDV